MLGEFYPWEAILTARAEPAAPADEHAVLELMAQQVGTGAARLAERWWRVQPEAFTVLRRRDGGIEGLMVLPRLTEGPLPVPGDPVARAALAWSREHRPLGPGEQIVLGRWLVGEASHPATHGSIPLTCRLTLCGTTTPGTALSYTVLPEGDLWAPVLSFAGHRRLPELTDVDGRRRTPFVFDWQETPPREWLRIMEDRQLERLRPVPAGTR
ncbi:hypothetical protein LWP59_20170 [Amycolatopsis acidiphila]|uniref:GNAT family N-acetyltransferase n=1 Tax=Amycolatopsis acidiphila TaxID=715473 RepID=A0A558AG91_9PSEU|nr:hypothetical protein [Amycolatopsis acidiphila]TVT23287.1 hypothetical protein FNH06_10365 [Amycolatopsis acidiphila]UIJ56511.1 hypothetical protein LWP59_20170 [Amycolatopsis acidiphila]GHG66882.1 hypothetical protein GCM10017788_25300 [Amycolatopsis acidiphila]